MKNYIFVERKSEVCHIYPDYSSVNKRFNFNLKIYKLIQKYGYVSLYTNFELDSNVLIAHFCKKSHDLQISYNNDYYTVVIYDNNRPPCVLVFVCDQEDGLIECLNEKIKDYETL